MAAETVDQQKVRFIQLKRDKMISVTREISALITVIEQERAMAYDGTNLPNQAELDAAYGGYGGMPGATSSGMTVQKWTDGVYGANNLRTSWEGGIDEAFYKIA